MEVRASKHNSTTLDSVLTLIDTISCRLQLLSQDYRGSDDLKPELILLQKLLLRVSFSRSSQSFLLFFFSEELRHFYFLLRSERRLVYVMVEEIAKFRESVKIFQRQFFEMNTTMLDAVSDKLQSLLAEHPEGTIHGDLSKLKVELTLIRVFCICAINLSKNQASLEFPLFEIKCRIYEEVAQFYSFLFTLEDSSLDHELVEGFCSFRESLLKCCKEQISELYTSMLGSLLQCNASPWLCCELDEFFLSLFGSLGKIILWGSACDPRINQLIEPVRNIMIFLHKFFRFATLGTPCIVERFFIFCQGSIINAASLGYMCWFYRDDDQVFYDLQSKCSELVENVWPVNARFNQNYIETLIVSRQFRSSFFSVNELDRYTVAEFVDSLLDYLFDLVYGSTTFLVSFDQLKVLTKVMYGFQKRMSWLDDIDEIPQRGVIDAVDETAVIIFQLYMLKRKDELAEEMEVKISQLLGNTSLRMLAGEVLQSPFHCLRINGIFIDRDVGIEDIKNQLLSRSSELDIVSITGDGRLTNVAKMVYTDSEVINHFEVRAWCPVSEECNRKTLLTRTLACIFPNYSYDYAEMSAEDLAVVLHKCLKEKRYLLVLDNLSIGAWRALRYSFPKDDNQSRILLTSQFFNRGFISFEAASKPHYLHQLMVKAGNCFKGS